MARRLRESTTTPPGGAVREQQAVVPVDPVSGAAVIAAGLRDTKDLDRLLRLVLPDQLQVRESREGWAALGELRRRGLEPDRMAVAAIAGEQVAEYLSAIAASVEPTGNLDWHVGNVFWDHARATAARGPVTSFLEALKDAKADRDRVRALARQIAESFEGHGSRGYLHDPSELVRAQMLEIEKRVSGHAAYPFGIPGLDRCEDGRKRMVPGTAPGQFTAITASPGAGKSTMAARIALGIAFPEGVEDGAPGRKVVYGAWEMGGGMTLEVISCLSLGWSRTDLMDPESARPDSPIRTHEGRRSLQERMGIVASRIRFMAMPFKRRAGEKASNERNLDLLQGYLADAGCDVFIADLWKRCLAGDRGTSPEAEEDALIRQQAMSEELKIHVIALQQQRHKDVESRPDKRPTREGIKGSGAWTEVSDTIIGVHRPALWKSVPDSRLEAIVLKQRYGRWPLAVEFDWCADRGLIEGGRSVDYVQPGEQSDVDAAVHPHLGHRRRRLAAP